MRAVGSRVDAKHSYRGFDSTPTRPWCSRRPCFSCSGIIDPCPRKYWSPQTRRWGTFLLKIHSVMWSPVPGNAETAEPRRRSGFKPLSAQVRGKVSCGSYPLSVRVLARWSAVDPSQRVLSTTPRTNELTDSPESLNQRPQRRTNPLSLSRILPHRRGVKWSSRQVRGGRSRQVADLYAH
jgi:hypothetical protein